MTDIVKRYTCDACGKSTCVADDDNVPSWVVKTDAGELCPSCYSAWESWTSSFVERMRKENGGNLV